jgi:transposase
MDGHSIDLRERVVAAVKIGGSCDQAAKQFGIDISTAISWVRRLRDRQRCARQNWRVQAKIDLGRAPNLAAAKSEARRLHLARTGHGTR